MIKIIIRLKDGCSQNEFSIKWIWHSDGQSMFGQYFLWRSCLPVCELSPWINLKSVEKRRIFSIAFSQWAWLKNIFFAVILQSEYYSCKQMVDSTCEVWKGQGFS